MSRENRGELAESAPILGRQPCWDEVLSELAKLRTGYGISHERVRAEAGALQSLAATEDEVARRLPATVRREVAALDVVRCAIEHDVIRTDLHLILKYTLNFVGEDLKLGDRVALVAKKLCVGRDAVERRFSEAYGGLASILVSLGESSCRERGQQTRTAAADIGFLLEAVTKSLAAGLAALTIETRRDVRETVASAILHQIPFANERVAEYDDDHPTRVAALDALLLALTSYGDPDTPYARTLMGYRGLLDNPSDIERQRRILQRPPDPLGLEPTEFDEVLTDVVSHLDGILDRFRYPRDDTPLSRYEQTDLPDEEEWGQPWEPEAEFDTWLDWRFIAEHRGR